MSSRVGIADWPRLTRFYGITPLELSKMPNALIALYAEELLVLSAEEALLGFLTSDMPYMSKTERQKAHRAFDRYMPDAEPEKLDPRSATGSAVLAGMGIAVNVPAREVESPVGD